MVLRNCKAGCFLYDLARLQKMQKCIFSLSDKQTPFSIFSLKKYRVNSLTVTKFQNAMEPTTAAFKWNPTSPPKSPRMSEKYTASNFFEECQKKSHFFWELKAKFDDFQDPINSFHYCFKQRAKDYQEIQFLQPYPIENVQYIFELVPVD